MPNKTPERPTSKKKGKSLAEKRAAKQAKRAERAAQEKARIAHGT